MNSYDNLTLNSFIKEYIKIEDEHFNYFNLFLDNKKNIEKNMSKLLFKI